MHLADWAANLPAAHFLDLIVLRFICSTFGGAYDVKQLLRSIGNTQYDDGLQLSLKTCFGLKLVYTFVLLHSCCKKFSRLASQ